MGDCTLQIVLDEPDRIYEPGEQINGRVVVEVDDSVRCDGLSVEHRWKTHGRGNTDWAATGAMTLFQGEWEEPGRYEYEFEFEQPPGPETYHGHYLNVDWYVFATADIPWAFDPDAEVDHLARYVGPRDEYQIGSVESLEKVGQDVQGQGCPGCLGAFGVALAVMAASLFLTFASEGGVGPLVSGLVMLTVGLGLAWAGFSRVLAKRKLGDIDVALEPTHVFPGEKASCSVTLIPPDQIELNGLVFTLRSAEVVIRGSGTNKRTYRQDLLEREEKISWPEPKTLEAGVEYTFEESFQIPTDAPPSFDSGDDNKLEWSVETRVDIPSWPDWSTRNLLVVVPGQAPEAEPEGDEAQGDEAEDWW